MDADGKTRLARQMQLCGEEFALGKATVGILFPIVVEANLADGDDLRMPRPREETVAHLIRQRSGLLGVNADSGVECGMCLGIRHDLRGRFHGVPHTDDARHARRRRAGDCLRQIVRELLIIEMRVRVEKYAAHTISIRGKSCFAVPTM